MPTESYLLLGAACLAFRPTIHWFLKKEYERYFYLVFLDSSLLLIGIFFLGKAFFLALLGIW